MSSQYQGDHAFARGGDGLLVRDVRPFWRLERYRRLVRGAPRQWLVVVVVLVAVFGLLSGGAILLQRSVWLAWFSLPGEADLKLALTQALPPPLQAAAAPLLPTAADSAPIVAISQGFPAVLVLAPWPWQYGDTWQALDSEGWHGRWHGLVIRATRGSALGETTLPSFRETLGNVLATVAAGSVPLNPPLVASFTIPSHTPARLQAIATAGGGELKVLVRDAAGGTDLRLLPASANTTRVSVPGEVLRALPQPAAEALNSLLRERLGFTHTSPDLIGILKRHSLVHLTLDNPASVVAVQGNQNEFLAAVEDAAKEEERYTRLTTRRFHLPDGTLGRELVPGPAQPVLQEQGTCLTPIEQRTTLHLCWDDSGLVTLNTADSLSVEPTRPLPTGTWEVAIAADTMVAVQDNLACDKPPRRASLITTGGPPLATVPTMASAVQHLLCATRGLSIVGQEGRVAARMQY